MKTNYKQSQAAPHAKPIFTVSRNDSTLYVLPAYLAGAVMIRLQHIADGDKVKKLCCKVKNDRLMAMEQDVPQGNVTLTAVDIISPEKCAEKGYRKDGYGYVRTLLVTPTAEHRAICIKAADTASLPERFGRAFLGRACNRPWLVLNLTGPCRGVIRSRVVGSLSPREK